MKVSGTGEFGLIGLLAEMVESARDGTAPAWRELIVGIGDDAAAWRADGLVQLATVDSMVEGVHFAPGLTPLHELGWKALAVNLSDIAAMGGSPRYALIALSLPGDTDIEEVRGFYRGMLEAAREYRVALAGGNISRSPIISVSITVLGAAESPERLLRRSAAQPGDAIAVTGYLGTAAAGLDMLKSGIRLDIEVAAYLRKAFLHPCPRTAEGELAARAGIRTAIDISDGLLADLGHVCEASRVGARLFAASIPIDPIVRAKFGARVLELALSGGEDYELLFTGSLEAIEKVAGAASCPVTVIGEVVPAPETGERITLLDRHGAPVRAGNAGWEHFRAR